MRVARPLLYFAVVVPAGIPAVLRLSRHLVFVELVPRSARLVASAPGPPTALTVDRALS